MFALDSDFKDAGGTKRDKIQARELIQPVLLL